MCIILCIYIHIYIHICILRTIHNTKRSHMYICTHTYAYICNIHMQLSHMYICTCNCEARQPLQYLRPRTYILLIYISMHICALFVYICICACMCQNYCSMQQPTHQIRVLACLNAFVCINTYILCMCITSFQPFSFTDTHTQT